jgi:hypothetical protein
MNQLADALEAAGYTPNDVTKLRSKPEALKEFKLVLGGMSKIVAVKHVIDLDANPMVPDGWSVEEHQRGGSFKWNPAKVAPYLSKKQMGNKRIEGNKLRKELEGKFVFNACLLDYLLAYPQLIPEEWKGKTFFFWGTIYRRNSDGNLCVRCLLWYDRSWDWGCYWIDDNFFDFDGDNPAAVLASN